MRATECGKAAWTKPRADGQEPDKRRGIAEQGERASKREAPWSRLRRCKSGGCAGKDRVLTWGDLALWLKGRSRRRRESEKSAEAVVAAGLGRRAEREGKPTIMWLGCAGHQKPGRPGRAERGRDEAWPGIGRDEARPARRETEGLGRDLLEQVLARAGRPPALMTPTSRTARCVPACRVVWEGHGQID